MYKRGLKNNISALYKEKEKHYILMYRNKGGKRNENEKELRKTMDTKLKCNGYE